MRAEILSIGDELITGQRLDTNSQWLSERLTELGVEVAFHTTIGDRLADNVAAFRTAVERVDAIVVTGGLGPTADDLTREALAAVAGVPLIRDEASLAHIGQLFAGRGREMPERNNVQADFPQDATPIFNEHGTAPGIAMTIRRQSSAGSAQVFALPGVPAEMKPMWAAYVAGAVAAASGSPRVIRHRRIKCFGVGESALEAMLPDLIRRGREPVVGITVSDATITLRITATGADDAQCRAAIEPTERIIRESLGSIVFGEEEEELEDAVVRLLRSLSTSQGESPPTVAVAEWATGGAIAEQLVAACRRADAENLFAGGSTIVHAAGLQKLLGTQSDAQLAPHAAETAVRMAESIRQQFGATYGLAVAAFPPVVDAPDAHVNAALAAPDGTHKVRFGCASHPALRVPRTARQLLNALRLLLEKT